LWCSPVLFPFGESQKWRRGIHFFRSAIFIGTWDLSIPADPVSRADFIY
jgi:hypothetical protein